MTAGPGLSRASGISVLGDSYATGIAGYQDSPWPRLLERSARVPVSIVARAGATLEDVADRQVSLAVGRGDRIAIALAGANDILRTPRPDLAHLRRVFLTVLEGLRSRLPGVSLVVVSYPNFAPHLPFLPRSRARVEASLGELNRGILGAGEAVGAQAVDLAAVPELAGRDHFGPDGLHLSGLGHDAVARVVESALRGERGGAP